MAVQANATYAITNYTSAFLPTTCSEDLTPCPSSPNCINTEDYDPISANRLIPPIEVPKSIATHQLKKIFQTAIDDMRRELYFQHDIWLHDRLKITKNIGYKVDVEYRTFSGFVDKWTIRVNEGLIQSKFRSLLGYSDLGVNRENYLSFYEKVVYLLERQAFDNKAEQEFMDKIKKRC